jgi:hypothetical protein
MDCFASMLSALGGRLPSVACWRNVAGHPERVIDLWKGDTGRPGYQPDDERQSACFEPLRQVAPRESMQWLHPLPCSARR